MTTTRSITQANARNPSNLVSRSCTLSVLRSPWLLPALVGLLAVFLFVAEVYLFSRQHPHIVLSPESNQADLLLSRQGFHATEEDGRGSFRWTTGDSWLHVAHFGRGDTLVLGLHLGPAPPNDPPASFRLAFGGTERRSAAIVAADDQPRRYRFLVPSDALSANRLTLHLESDTTVVSPDTREVGLRVEGITFTFIGSRFATPTLAMIAAQSLFLVVWALMLHRLRAPLLVSGAVLVATSVLLLLLYDLHLLLMYGYLVRLLVASGVLALLTFLLLPVAERYAAWVAPPPLMRVLWGVALLACMVRLVGSLYPVFAAYDLSLNVGRLLKTLNGTLVVTNNSIEFRNGVTVYPPGPYIVLLPGLLARVPPALLVQGGIAIIDGFGALLVGAMARVLGAGGRTALFSALLYAAIPIHLTALWWGLTAQIFGQALMPPLLIALLVALNEETSPRNRSRAWVAVTVLLSMSLLSHIGVAILAVAWLGVAWLVLRLRQTVPLGRWWSLTSKLVISGLVGVAFAYSAVAVLMVEQFFAVGEKVVTSDYVPAYWLIYRGFKISFHEVGFWLLVPGLLLLWRRRLPTGGADLVASWLLVVGVFWVVEMMTALQVRYIYFLTPLACLAIGLLLDRLAARGRGARLVAWGVVMVLLVQGGAYWYTGTFGGLMMSVSPLLR